MHVNQKWTYCILGSGFAQNLSNNTKFLYYCRDE